MERARELLRKREASIFILLIVMIIFFSIASNQFLTFANIRDSLKSNALLVIMATGMSLILITGGIDMSAVAVLGMIQMIFGRLMAYAGWGIMPVVLITILCGLLFGIINGLLISRGKIAPIVATLGMGSIISGSMYIFMKASGSSSLWINSNELPKWFLDFGAIKILGLPIQIYIAAVIVIVTWIIMKYTIIGRSIYALGGNKSAAERIGINVDRTILSVYAYFGLILSIGVFSDTAGIMLCDPNSFLGMDFEAVAAVVVGGVTMVGGHGSVLGGMLGSLFMIFLSNGLGLIRVNTFWQKVIVGIVIIVAVSIEASKRHHNERHAHTIDVM